MANIKGITIEIAGNTSKLTKALDESKRALVQTSSELRAVNNLLKLDPSNVTLLSQKQVLLAKAIEDTKTRLSQLKELQQQFGSQSNLTEEQKEKYRLLEREIAQCEGQLKSYEKQQLDVNDSISDVNEGQPFEEVDKDIQDASKSALKMGDIIKANLISDAIKAGIKGLANGFKTLSNTMNDWSNKANQLQEQEAKVRQVMKNTTGATDDQIQSLIDLTAKQEKLGVVSQETQLAGLQELGTYVEHKKSLEKLLPVMNDMIAQQYGVGASMESASGIATMMGKVLGNGQVDALSRLGYKFTDAQKKVLKFGTEEQKVNMLTKIITQSVGGMNKALAQTDAGKMLIAKSYFEDFQKTIGKTFNDFKAKVVGMFLPQIETIAISIEGILDGSIALNEGLQDIISGLLDGFKELSEELPDMLETFTDIFQVTLGTIFENLPDIIHNIMNFLTEILKTIIDNIPMIVDVVLETIAQIADALAEQLPTLIPYIVDGLLNLIDVMLDHIDQFIDVAIKLILALADGLIEALPKLIDKAPEIIEKLTKALIKNAPKIKAASDELMLKLVLGLLEIKKKINEVGIQLIIELWEGMKSKLEWLWERAKAIGNNLVYYLSLGLLGEKDDHIRDVAETFINNVETGIEQSVNNNAMELKEDGIKIGASVEGGAVTKLNSDEGQTIGQNFVTGIQKGVQNKTKVQQASNAVAQTAQALVDRAKRILKISSPSKVTEEIGKYFDEGLQIGIEDNANSVVRSATLLSNSLVGSVDGIVADTNSAMRSLTSGVNASVNPTINPTANSNPLYITIDKFYNNRGTDIQQLAQELEFYRKNSALARGGN